MRKTALKLFVAGVMLAGAGKAIATTHYVDLNSANATPPYTNWVSAATNIQDAVDAAVAGDEVVVSNGVYTTPGRTVDGYTINVVVLDKPLKLRSVNGPESTSIDGGYADFGESRRCIYLTNGASLAGFTLANGICDGHGGGALGEVYDCTLSNCVLNDNSASDAGGGAYGCTLNDCILTGNLAGGDFWGIGPPFDTYGGGASSCTLNNCILARNSADGYTQSSGGGAYGCTLNNCTLVGNSAIPHSHSECEYWCESGGQPFCCRTRLVQGSAYGGGAYSCTLNNCIIYSNTDNKDGGNYYASFVNYCCTTPMPYGSGNLTNAPLFMDSNWWADLRLQSNSPCINAGDNARAPAGPDLDGNPRVAGGTVDMGAYEYQAPVSQISYAWLQEYGLPVDGSTDTADPDGDGVDNYHEWLAGTDPTSRFSSPAQLTIISSGTNVILTWSTNAVGFTLQSTPNLGASVVWATNSPSPVVINGQNTITNPISGRQQFYRLVH
jgi:hypothetical protein